MCRVLGGVADLLGPGLWGWGILKAAFAQSPLHGFSAGSDGPRCQRLRVH